MKKKESVWQAGTSIPTICKELSLLEILVVGMRVLLYFFQRAREDSKFFQCMMWPIMLVMPINRITVRSVLRVLCGIGFITGRLVGVITFIVCVVALVSAWLSPYGVQVWYLVTDGSLNTGSWLLTVLLGWLLIGLGSYCDRLDSRVLKWKSGGGNS